VLGASIDPEVSARTLLRLDDKKAAPKSLLRIGLVTDVHYAEKKNGGSRHYRESLEKMAVASKAFRAAKVDFAVEVGDFVDAAPQVEVELGYLHRIEKAFAKCHGERHYVLGNHCVDTLKKSEFLENTGHRRKEKKAYYSFDKGAIHFVILDACFRPDEVDYGRNNSKWNEAEIPKAEREWLVKDLAATKKPTVVFVHQRLDVDNNYGVRSGAVVRKILADSEKVLAVFQGHNHVNEHRTIDDVHYVTLAAMIEGPAAKSNAYSIVDCFPGGVIKIDGFASQKDWEIGSGT